MKNKTYQTFDEAVADIPDGSVFMSAGFGGGRSHTNTSSSGTVHVGGYYRKNGTYVPADH